MINKTSLTIITAALLAATVLFAPNAPSAAQGMAATTNEFSAQQQDSKKATRAVTPRATRTVTPRATRTVTPRATRTVTPRATRTVTPRATRTVTPRATRTVTPRATRAVTPRATRTVTPRATRTVTPRATRTVTPRATRTVTPRAIRTVTPRGSRAVTGGRLRGAGRAAIQGHNYSVWRGRHRVRHGGGWRTFGALSALGAIIIGSNQYYPYAYISAPENYCEGLTEDGCELMWQDVETIEGDVVPQCVAYCPWQ
jgi:hypothetical protein